MEVNNINSNKLNGSMGTISLFCLLQIFLTPTPTLLALSVVTNAHIPSPQTRAFRSPTNSLVTRTEASFKPRFTFLGILSFQHKQLVLD